LRRFCELVIPAKAGIQQLVIYFDFASKKKEGHSTNWMTSFAVENPAFAGMTKKI
jgi:hypothetical protein